MTNRERLKGLIGFEPSEESIEGSMADLSVDGDLTYSVTALPSLKKAAIEVLKTLLSAADITNENGFTHKYDRNAVLKRIAALEEEENPTDSIPKIRNKSFMW